MSQEEDNHSDIAADPLENEKPKRKWCDWKCCVFGGIYFKTFSLGLTVLLYLLFGGVIFLALEKPAENDKNQNITNASSSLALLQDQIITFLTNGTVLDDSNAENLVDMLKRLTMQNSTSTTENWDYGSSVFFCTTVITTIGTVRLNSSGNYTYIKLHIYTAIKIAWLHTRQFVS